MSITFSPNKKRFYHHYLTKDLQKDHPFLQTNASEVWQTAHAYYSQYSHYLAGTELSSKGVGIRGINVLNHVGIYTFEELDAFVYFYGRTFRRFHGCGKKVEDAINQYYDRWLMEQGRADECESAVVVFNPMIYLNGQKYSWSDFMDMMQKTHDDAKLSECDIYLDRLVTVVRPYANDESPEIDRANVTSTERDLDMCRRFKQGECAKDIARDYGITKQRFYQIMHKFKV